jgi:hypothetical protein
MTILVRSLICPVSKTNKTKQIGPKTRQSKCQVSSVKCQVLNGVEQIWTDLNGFGRIWTGLNGFEWVLTGFYQPRLKGRGLVYTLLCLIVCLSLKYKTTINTFCWVDVKGKVGFPIYTRPQLELHCIACHNFCPHNMGPWPQTDHVNKLVRWSW